MEQDWSMESNPSKCEAITFTQKTKPMKGVCKLCNQVLITVPSAKYLGVHLNNKLSWNNHDITTKKVVMLKSFFSDIQFSEPKIPFFSIIVYQPTQETGSDRRRVRIMSPAVRCQCADVSLVVPSAHRPHDPLQLHLQQQWCIPPTATVWRLQALTRRTVARGMVGQRLLWRRTGTHQLRQDKADIKRHPADDMLHGGPTDKPGKCLPVSPTCELKATDQELKSDTHWWNWLCFQQAYIKASNRTFTVQMRYTHTRIPALVAGRSPCQ